MKKLLLALLFVATSLHADNLLYQVRLANGKPTEISLPITAGTFINFDGSGRLQTRTTAQFKSALGIAISDVTSLQSALDAKVSTTNSQFYSTSTQAAGGYYNTPHGHKGWIGVTENTLADYPNNDHTWTRLVLGLNCYENPVTSDVSYYDASLPNSRIQLENNWVDNWGPGGTGDSWNEWYWTSNGPGGSLYSGRWFGMAHRPAVKDSATMGFVGSVQFTPGPDAETAIGNNYAVLTIPQTIPGLMKGIRIHNLSTSGSSSVRVRMERGGVNSDAVDFQLDASRFQLIHSKSGRTAFQTNLTGNVYGGPYNTEATALHDFYGSALFRNDLTLSGLLNLPTTTSSVGQLRINGVASLHAYGTSNIFLGASAGNFTLSGTENVAVGPNALKALTSGTQNTAAGSNAGALLTTGGSNVAFGASALSNNATSANNSAFGALALQNSTGVGNVGIGRAAGYSITSGVGNTFLGTSTSGGTLTTGSDNTLLGANADVNANNLSNATAIGSGAIADASNAVVLGNSSVTRGGVKSTKSGVLWYVPGTLEATTIVAPTASASAAGLLPAYTSTSNFATVRIIGGNPVWGRWSPLQVSIGGVSNTGTSSIAQLPGATTVLGNLPGTSGQVATGSDTTGSANVVFGTASTTPGTGFFTPANGSDILFSGYITVSALSDGTNTFLYWFGLLGAHGVSSTSITNMVGFRIEGSTLKAVCMSGGSETTLTWTGTAVASTPLFVQARWNVLGGSVSFWVNGALIDGSTGTINTNIPATSQAQKLETMIVKSAGTTARGGYFSQPELWFLQP